jgi:formate C-acetyltransferase
MDVVDEQLRQMREPFGAGFLEQPDAAPITRYAGAYRRWFEEGPLPAYDGGPLYPCGPHPYGSALAPNYSYTMAWDEEAFQRKRAEASEAQQEALDRLKCEVRHELARVPLLDSPHTVGGNGYTHGIINYERALREGLAGYERRVREAAAGAFREGMLDLLEGLKVWQGRLRARVMAAPADPGRVQLTTALERVPWEPAGSFLEAIVAYNALFYIDGCDNPGRIDLVLWPYLRDDDAMGQDDALALLEAFFDNVCANSAWSAAIGGTDECGAPAYNPVTNLCLKASQGRFRPSLELRVREDMPEAVWNAAFDALGSGSGQPAFYSEKNYYKALRRLDPSLTDRDLAWWNGGGCTETMIAGRSNVGSLDAGLNLPLILVETLRRELTREPVTFEGLVEAFLRDAEAAIAATLDALNRYFELRAKHRPQPVRTLLVDDCVDAGRDFNDGGARYNWSVVNVAGVANVADALAALEDVVFTRGRATPREMRDALEANFEGCEALRQALAACPKFGNDADAVDALAARVAERVYAALLRHPCRRGRFAPAHIMFETFAHAGAAVGATPDGRLSGAPLADSCGPVQGRDAHGVTAMLRSAAKLPQCMAAGTPVLNLRISRGALQSAAGRARLQALIEGYFHLGGMQLQISATDRAELEDALARPERHDDLIVRIGGYSAHVTRLSPELQREVVARMEHALL